MTTLHRRISLLLAAAYLLALAFIAFWPTPVDRPIDETLTHVITWLHAHGMPSFIGYNKIEFAANIALFAPLGYVVSSLWARRWWQVALIGFAVSCVIELGQALLLPDRFASALDIVANTAGAALGAGIFALAHLRPAAITRSENPQQDPAA